MSNTTTPTTRTFRHLFDGTDLGLLSRGEKIGPVLDDWCSLLLEDGELPVEDLPTGELADRTVGNLMRSLEAMGVAVRVRERGKSARVRKLRVTWLGRQFLEG